MIETEYIRIERVHKGKIFQSLEKEGKRCFPLNKAGIQHVLDTIAEKGLERVKMSFVHKMKMEPDIWEYIFDNALKDSADDVIKKFNIYELPPKGKLGSTHE